MNAGTFLYLLQGDHDFSDELFRVGREAVVDDCNLARKSGGGVAFLADELHQATVLRGRLGVVSAEAHACAERSGQINDVARKAVGLVKHEEFAVVLPEAALVQVLLRYAEADLAEEDQRFGLRGGKTARGELERGVVRRGQRRVDPEKAKRGRMDERDLAERRMPHILELAKARVELALDALELLLLLYDGGLADPIPILRSLHDGNERNLIVLTQPESYRKTLGRGVQFTAKWLKRKYPAMPKVLLERAKHYNETVCFCHRLAENKPQDTVLLQPEKSLNSFEKDVKKLEWGYEMGYNMTCARMEQIKNLFR